MKKIILGITVLFCLNNSVFADYYSSGRAMTGAISSKSFTRPNDTTPYSIGDVVGTSPAANLTFSNVALVSGGSILITGVSLEIDVNAVSSGMSTFILHLYNVAPTAIADNAAYNLSAADRAKYLGNITISAPVDLGDTLYVENNNIGKLITLANGSTTIYGILTTSGAYTPTAQAVKKITLYTAGV
jgi:hypothetical protein